ncbi:class I SAM-dependent methyltransferase [Kribbella sp. NPDC023972]|uniref:class I SAM-dependent methyltransferase n=1 Tax=Kribbella sp. NPDC023972 TaxID=3154795 RepID=UPI0033C617B9
MSSWLERWDAVLAGHFPGRDQEFELALTVIQRLVGRPKKLVDLACGPGSLALRAARRFPEAEILGVDLDPVLLEIARGAAGSERVRFVDGDLLDPGWSRPLGEVDVICATAALHYLDPAELPRLAGILADGVRVDGVVLISDTFRIGVPRLDSMVGDLRRRALSAHETAAHEGETWSSWWSAVAAEPAFADLLRLRDQRLGSGYEGLTATLDEAVETLRQAGFAEVAPIRQDVGNFLLVAIR